MSTGIWVCGEIFYFKIILSQIRKTCFYPFFFISNTKLYRNCGATRYENTPKTENVQIKNADNFHISAQNIEPRRFYRVPTIYVFEQK